MKIFIHVKNCTQMFIGVIFIIAKKWKQHKCASDEWKINVSYPYTIEYFWQ